MQVPFSSYGLHNSVLYLDEFCALLIAPAVLLLLEPLLFMLIILLLLLCADDEVDEAEELVDAELEPCPPPILLLVLCDW